jgi:O-antigen/teichoic acid export membrane protein
LEEKAEENRSVWGTGESQIKLIARNVTTDYVAIAVNIIVGMLMLPFNVSHLGKSAYGLWILTASIMTYFSMLELGYGSAQVKFAAQYRARRDSQAINEVASTLFFLFVGLGIVAYSIAVVLAFNFERLFNVTPEQASTGRTVLLILAVYVALGFPFSVFGGIVNGFQRNYLNGVVSIINVGVQAIVNVIVILAGYGIVELVATTTAVHVLCYGAYRANAYRVFPSLRIRLKYVKATRLREVTAFSSILLLIEIAAKINYATDTMVIGAFMSTAAIAVWAVAQRLIAATRMLTNQLNSALFPVVVDNAAKGRPDRLRFVLIQGTRLSLAMVIPIASVLCLLAQPVVLVWVGPGFLESVPVIYLLAGVVTTRVGCATATTLLKGADRHKFLAGTNLAIAVVNVILSIILVQRLGLIGVALGTLIPLGAASIFIIFPAACRRVGLSIRDAVWNAVLPAVWPMTLVAALLLVTRNLVGHSLVSIAAQSVTAGLLYAVIFIRFALSKEDRQWYIAKFKQLTRRRPRVAVTAYQSGD